jgi:hypothetical protein
MEKQNRVFKCKRRRPFAEFEGFEEAFLFLNVRDRANRPEWLVEKLAFGGACIIGKSLYIDTDKGQVECEVGNYLLRNGDKYLVVDSDVTFGDLFEEVEK